MLPRICSQCGSRFVAETVRKKYCNKCLSDHNKRRTLSRFVHDVEFVGVDGEGVNRPDGTHDYVLLSVGNKSLYYPDGRRLTFYDIIPFLWNCFLEKPNAAYVGFYLGYDFTNWLRDLPENRARYLLDNKYIQLRQRIKSGGNHTPFAVEHKGWYFDILPMRRLRLWRADSNLRMYICDTGAFFQTSFLNAINPTKWSDGPIVSETEYKKIAIGKSERGQDTVEYETPISDEMVEYNILENEVLARLMKRYNEGLVKIGVKLKRDQWFGPGQAAQAWMKRINAPKRQDFQETTTLEIRRSLQASYYGGWFEIFAHGHIPGTSYSYDINSAYPDIQSTLPCCLHGKWTRSQECRNLLCDDTRGRLILIFATISGNNRYIGVAPHRTRTGHILRPNRTKGWYWWSEIQIAKDIGLITEITVHEWIEYIPCNCEPPFRNERTLYEDRLRVGKDTTGGKARKLIYNSAYGKTAQSIGTAKFANSLYASLITSGCRTRILESILSYRGKIEDVLMVATDSITFRKRHTTLNLSNTELGAWTETEQQNLTLFMPGIYWDDSSREKLRLGDHPTLKSRGIPGKQLAQKIFEIDELFSDEKYIFGGHGWPTIDIPINFSIISPKQALAWNRWEDCGKIDFKSIRSIDSNPRTKRASGAIESGIIRTYAYIEGPSGIETTPYNRTFGDDELRELDDQLTPDGYATMLIPEAIK